MFPLPFPMIWLRVGLIIAAVLAIALAGYKVGSDRVQAKWDIERAKQTEIRLEAEQAARKEEQRRAEESQRIASEQSKREAEYRDRVAAAEQSLGGLRDTVARLNSRPAPRGAEAAGYAREASVARELLGSCTSEYRGVAAEADGLRNQVIGLQQWVNKVVQ
jgi:chromosome segregation ATPase